MLDRTKHLLAVEAEDNDHTQGVERFVLRPHLEGMRQPASPDKLHEAQTSLLSEPIKLPMDCWWRIIVIRRKESCGSENTSDLGQGRRRFHPVERLGSSDDISAFIRQARLMS